MKYNFRHRYAIIAVRVILGLFLLMSGVTGLMAGTSHMEGVPMPMVVASQSLWSMGLFQLVKVTEAVSGLMLIFGFLPALAAIFIAPLAIAIIVFNTQIAPQFVPTGIFLAAMDAYLGYAYWDKYKALFTRK